MSATSTSSSITVQWGMVPCIHRNGDITGYSVQYWQAVGSGSIQTLPVIESDAMMTTIPALISSTVYSIQVAAVNNAGPGDYSVSITLGTPLSKL